MTASFSYPTTSSMAPVLSAHDRATVPAMRKCFLTLVAGPRPLTGILVLALSLSACGKKPAKGPEAGDAAEESAGAPAAEVEDTSPLEPAPAPSGVFLRARVKNPGALLSSVGDAASSPLDLRRLIAEEDPRVGRVLDRVVDIDAPVEALMALHPVSGEDPMAVFSVSARGVRAALQGLDAEGIDTRQGPEGLHYFELSGDECALGRSLGPSPARIVCADRAESLNSLQAYALRGFPAEPLGDAEIAVRVLAEPLQKQYGKQLRGLRLLGGVAARQVHQDHPRFDAAASDAILGLVDELIAVGEDVQALTFDLWDREGAFESELVLTLAGATSWLVGTSREWVRTQGPAPDLALRLPAEATSAGYFRQPPQKQCERLARVIGELGAGALEAKDVSRATADKLARSLTAIFAADRTVVYATGPFDAKGKPEPSKAQDDRARATWTLLGVDQERKQVLEILDGLAFVLADKQFQKIDVEPRHRPHLAKKQMNLGRGLSAQVYEYRLPESVVSALREGTEELAKEGVTGANAAGVDQLERGYIAVSASGKATWLALAPDQSGLTEALTKVGAEGSRLAAAPEFSGFFERAALVAAGIRLSGVVDQMAPVLSAETLKTARQALTTAPHRGVFPATSFFTVTAGGATQLSVHTRIPDEFLTDAAALILALSAEEERAKKTR